MSALYEDPIDPIGCGKCSRCLATNNDPFECWKPGNVGKLLGPLKHDFDVETGRRKDKGPLKGNRATAVTGIMAQYMPVTGKLFSTDTLSSTFEQDKAAVKHEKCATTHPALALQDGLVVYGGAAADPVQQDCDIYVSLDYGTYYRKSAYPWNQPGPIFVCFPIQDMGVPAAPKEFRKMIEWLVAQIRAGKKVHVGCMGGHGRTGMVLAAIAALLRGDKDAISYVRKHYCPKAVETHKQGLFLQEHFGITPKEGYKEYHKAVKSGGGKSKAGSSAATFNATYVGGITLPVEPMVTLGNIWGV